jgi:hypothetical protein
MITLFNITNSINVYPAIDLNPIVAAIAAYFMTRYVYIVIRNYYITIR